MPQRYDESQALADMYAEALLRAADEQGQAEEVAEQFADLLAYMDRDPDFERFLTVATVDDEPRRASLEKLFRGRLNDLLVNLLQVLNNRFRCPLVRAIGRCVEMRMEERHHQQEVLVETAMPMTDDLRGALKTELSARIGKEALLIEEVRPELIGGVVIRIGDEQIDASVAAHIRLMRQRLLERASAEIHGSRGYEVGWAV